MSWPGLSRPSTTCGADGTKVVDGRTKSGHDTMGRAADSQLILARMGGRAPGLWWDGLSVPETHLPEDRAIRRKIEALVDPVKGYGVHT